MPLDDLDLNTLARLLAASSQSRRAVKQLLRQADLPNGANDVDAALAFIDAHPRLPEIESLAHAITETATERSAEGFDPIADLHAHLRTVGKPLRDILDDVAARAGVDRAIVAGVLEGRVDAPFSQVVMILRAAGAEPVRYRLREALKRQ